MILLCSNKNPPEVLYPDLGRPVQERQGPVIADPEQGQKIIRGLEHLSYKERLRGLRRRRDLIVLF